MQLDVASNRSRSKWTRKELLGRIMWAALRPLFRLSPRPGWGWRRALLRLMGAHIGRHVHIYPSVRITIPWNLSIGDYTAIGDGAVLYALGPISIGSRVTISQYAHLCAGSHDYHDPEMTLLKPPIAIGDDSWICANAFVGPGVTIGAGSVVGAAAVVAKDLPENVVAAGNPARVLKARHGGDGA